MITLDSRLKDFLNVDYSDFPEITEETRRENKKRVFVGGVRISQGAYRTKKEDDDYRKTLIERKLP